VSDEAVEAPDPDEDLAEAVPLGGDDIIGRVERLFDELDLRARIIEIAHRLTPATTLCGWFARAMQSVFAEDAA
jgi:hypothetical protein